MTDRLMSEAVLLGFPVLEVRVCVLLSKATMCLPSTALTGFNESMFQKLIW